MYSLDCSYYKKEFMYLDELIDDITVSGMDPNYEITCNGVPTGEMAVDLIVMYRRLLEGLEKRFFFRIFTG